MVWRGRGRLRGPEQGSHGTPRRTPARGPEWHRMEREGRRQRGGGGSMKCQGVSRWRCQEGGIWSWGAQAGTRGVGRK